MIIRQASLDAFQKMAITAFEDEMVKHCREFAPTICKPLGKETLRWAVQQGLEKARVHDFARRGSSKFYLECMLLFGSAFDTDPQYAWASAVLARNDFDEELHKAEALYEAVKAHRDTVYGPDQRYVRGCLRRLLRMLENDLPVQQESFHYDMVHLFEHLHPEKAEAAGPVGLEVITRHARERAREEYKITGIRSIAVITILMWLLGYRCDEDPFLPWIREALVIDPSQSTEAAGANLEKRAVAFFEAYLQELV
jgi:hypothetical protein